MHATDVRRFVQRILPDIPASFGQRYWLTNYSDNTSTSALSHNWRRVIGYPEFTGSCVYCVIININEQMICLK